MLLVYIHRILWFIGLVLIQSLVLNHIHIGGIATPLLYIYMVLKLPSGISRNELMLWAFFLGITVDIFSNTPGMNACATVALAFVRPYILRLFTPRDIPDSIIPSARAMGFASFLKYVLSCALVHSFLLFVVELFSFSAVLVLLSRVLTCTLLTTACVIAVEAIRRREDK
jgi:rod shape-determining protein MreD